MKILFNSIYFIANMLLMLTGCDKNNQVNINLSYSNRPLLIFTRYHPLLQQPEARVMPAG